MLFFIKMSVKLTVCIPVYNGAEYLKEAMDSVLSQDFTDLELIMIDNQSTDATVQIIQSYSDPRIKFFQNETNLGMLGNWNRALTLATGEYIKLLPADDVLFPGSLKAQVKILDEDTDQSIALVTGRRNVIDANGKFLFSRGYSSKTIEENGFKAINKVIRMGNNPIGEPGSVMFRRSILPKAGNFDPDIFYVMDLNMWLKMLLHGNLYSSKDTVCSFRISPVSESTRIVDTQRRDFDNFIRKIYTNKQYQLKTSNYRIGLFNSYVSSQLKKVVYKFVLK